MKPQREPIHINAKKEDISEICLLPGDPLRAKYIADTFLEDAKLVTSVRNMLGYTGTYKGKRITVMGHGMGMASVGIYAFELFYFYNVQKVIRIGTCGVCSEEVKIPEIILADKLYTEGTFGFQYDGYKGNIETPSADLVADIEQAARNRGLNIHKGAVITTDVFGPYVNDDAIMSRIPSDIQVLGEEMEGFALCHVANSFNRKAAVLLTAVDSKFTDKIVSPEERQTSLNDMIGLALDTLV